MAIESVPGLNQNVLKETQTRSQGGRSDSGSAKDAGAKERGIDQISARAARAIAKPSIGAAEAQELATATAKEFAGAKVASALAVQGNQTPQEVLSLLS